MSDQKPIPRSDDFLNAVTGLGGSYDRAQYGVFRRRPYLQYEELSDLYEQDAIASRVIDRLIDDATREGFHLTGPDQDFDFDKVRSDMEDLGAMTALGDAWRWSRLYGGALAVMIVSDGRRLDEPLDLDKARRLLSIQVIESPFVYPKNPNPGLGARGFRNPEQYELLVNLGNRDSRTVHRTRVIRFDGVRVPPSRLLDRNGWGPSLLDRVAREIFQLGEVMGYSRNIIHDMSIMAWKIEGLREQLCGGDQGQQEVRKVFETLRWSIDNLHAMVMDSKDDYGEVSRSVQGLKLMIEEFVSALVRATDMPRTILLGEQPSGLNANADSEIRSWFDYVHSQQRMTMTPAINRLLEVYFAIQANRGERIPVEWSIEYNPLWQMDEEQRARTRLANAQARAIDINSGAVSAEEVRADPLLVETYEIDPEAPPPPPPLPVPASGGAIIGQDDEGEEKAPPELPESYIRQGSTMVGPKQAGQALGVSAATVRRMAKEGDIPATLVGNRIKIPLEQAREQFGPMAQKKSLKADLAPTEHDELKTLLRAEVAYTRALGGLSRDLNRSINRLVVPRLAELAEEGPAAIAAAVSVAVAESGAELDDQQIEDMIDDQWRRVQNASDKTVLLMFSKASGIDRDDLVRLAKQTPEDPANPTRDEQVAEKFRTAMEAQNPQPLRNWRRENEYLIRDIPAKHRDDLSKKLIAAAAAGAAVAVLRQTVRSQAGITKRRTQTIAEDQTQWGVGELQRDRLTTAGIGKYRWRTVGDDRVRPEHAAREGRVFSWDNPPPDGQPGEAVNCRCVAEPVLDL